MKVTDVVTNVITDVVTDVTRRLTWLSCRLWTGHREVVMVQFEPPQPLGVIKGDYLARVRCRRCGATFWKVIEARDRDFLDPHETDRLHRHADPAIAAVCPRDVTRTDRLDKRSGVAPG